MSKFIRIGDTVINTDLVTDMEIGNGLSFAQTNDDGKHAK
jgi:hypothetical protein